MSLDPGSQSSADGTPFAKLQLRILNFLLIEMRLDILLCASTEVFLFFFGCDLLSFEFKKITQANYGQAHKCPYIQTRKKRIYQTK